MTEPFRYIISEDVFGQIPDESLRRIFLIFRGL